MQRTSMRWIIFFVVLTSLSASCWSMEKKHPCEDVTQNDMPAKFQRITSQECDAAESVQAKNPVEKAIPQSWHPQLVAPVTIDGSRTKEQNATDKLFEELAKWGSSGSAVVLRLIQQGADAKALNENGKTLLSVYFGKKQNISPKLVQQLLAAGAPANGCLNEAEIPIEIALKKYERCAKKHETIRACIEALLNYGAHADAPCGKKKLPVIPWLIDTKMFNSADLLPLLLCKPTPHLPCKYIDYTYTDNGDTLLMRLLRRSTNLTSTSARAVSLMIDVLINAGINLNTSNTDGENALIVSHNLYPKRSSPVKELLSPLCPARYIRFFRLIFLKIFMDQHLRPSFDRIAKETTGINQQDSHGFTTLARVLNKESTNLCIAEALISAGADFWFLKNVVGQTEKTAFTLFKERLLENEQVLNEIIAQHNTGGEIFNQTAKKNEQANNVLSQMCQEIIAQRTFIKKIREKLGQQLMQLSKNTFLERLPDFLNEEIAAYLTYVPSMY